MPTSLLIASAAALVASAALTPVVRALAARLDFYARPVGDRWNRSPVPLLGGVAIAATFALVLPWVTSVAQILPLLICSGAMCVLGLADDVWGLRPATKLVVQLAIAAALISLAPPVRLTGSIVIDGLLALTWLVGITNAFNLLDNMDGLAAGVAAIAGIFYLAVLPPHVAAPVTIAVAVFVGAVAGFLIYNFQPASIFMGDGGSFFIGSFLAGVGLLVAPELQPQMATVAAIPVLVLLVPIFDTTFVSLMRPLAGRSPMVGGRDHTSHRLVALGLGERRAVLVMYALAALGGGVALGVRHAEPAYAILAVGAYAVALAAVGVVLGHVEVTRAQSASAEGLAAPPLVSDIAYRNRVYEVLLDIALVGVAYYASFASRFQGDQFAQFLPYFGRSFPIVVSCQLAGLWLAGKYRQVWRSFGATELITILQGVAIGIAASVIIVLYLYRFIGFSRGVFVIDAVILLFLMVGARVVVVRTDEYLRRQRSRGRTALIYGAGRGGLLLARELLQNADLALSPVGFLDDDVTKRRLTVEGLPVLGTFAELPAIAGRLQVSEVLVSIRDLSSKRLSEAGEACAALGLRLRRMRFTLEEVAPHITARR